MKHSWEGGVSAADGVKPRLRVFGRDRQAMGPASRPFLVTAAVVSWFCSFLRRRFSRLQYDFTEMGFRLTSIFELESHLFPTGVFGKNLYLNTLRRRQVQHKRPLFPGGRCLGARFHFTLDREPRFFIKNSSPDLPLPTQHYLADVRCLTPVDNEFGDPVSMITFFSTLRL